MEHAETKYKSIVSIKRMRAPLAPVTPEAADIDNKQQQRASTTTKDEQREKEREIERNF